MVTSWPKRLPGPGMSAERVAERIAALSGGRLQISVSAAGEVVPAFEVLDAVGGGVAEIGHTASFFWQGKQPAAAFYTTVPFGLTPNEHVAWVEAGGDLAARSDMARKVHDSYAAFRDRTAAWSRVSIKAVLDAREG